MMSERKLWSPPRCGTITPLMSAILNLCLDSISLAFEADRSSILGVHGSVETLRAHAAIVKCSLLITAPDKEPCCDDRDNRANQKPYGG